MPAFKSIPMDVPPKDEAFYERINKNAANLQWFWTKFGEAMGVSPVTSEAMFNAADKALPAGISMTFTNAASRAVRDAAVGRLVADQTVGRFFVRNFSPDTYPHAYDFFQKAPTKLIQIVNSARRAKQRDLSTTKDGNGDGEAVGSNGINSGLYNEAAFGYQWAPRSTPSTPSTGLEREERAGTLQETADTKPQDAQGTRDGFHILKPSVPNTLELMSLKYGFPIAVNMTAIFGNSGRTPEPNEIYINTIRAGVQTVRAKRGMSIVFDADLMFKFFWIEDDVDKEMKVTDDDSLRAAYRVWLAAEDVSIPFVLCVDDTRLQDAWVDMRNLMEGGR